MFEGWLADDAYNKRIIDLNPDEVPVIAIAESRMTVSKVSLFPFLNYLIPLFRKSLHFDNIKFAVSLMCTLLVGFYVLFHSRFSKTMKCLVNCYIGVSICRIFMRI